MLEYVPFQWRAGVDLLAVRRELPVLLEQLARMTLDDDSADRLRLVGRVGELYYLPGNYQAAIPVLEEALIGAQRLGGKRLEVVNCIRLATSSRCLEIEGHNG